MVLKWPVTMTLHWVLYVLGIVCSGDCLSDLKSQSSWSENSAKTKQDVSVDSVCGGGEWVWLTHMNMHSMTAMFHSPMKTRK